jgi:cell division protein FtsB
VAKEAPRRRGRRPPRAALVRRWLAVAVLVVVGVFYARPVANYLRTSSALDQRRAEVQALRREKDALEQRVAEASRMDAVAREARRLGYVRPGEHLYIVKGIPAWLRAHAGSLGPDG